MKSNTKSIFLTLVLVLMSSVGLGEKCPIEKRALTSAESEYNVCKDAAEKDKCALSKMTDIQNRKRSAQESYDKCTAERAEAKEECKTISDRIKKRLEDFDYPAQKRALECMEGGTKDSADLTRAVLSGMGGNPTGSEDVCSTNSSKSSYLTQLEKKMTLTEKLEKEVKALDEKITTQKKTSTDQLADLNEDRIKLKEAWEKRQTEQEAEQAKALNAMRENQIKIQEAIRKANAELIDERQKMAKAERKRSEELLKAGVQSFSSMSRICNAQVKDYYKKAELNKKRRSGALGSALGKGSSKKEDLQSFKEDCMKSMEDKRNAIYEDTTNYLVQMANNLQDRQAAIATLEGEFKNQADSYRKALERDASALSKDQQAFLQKDQNLANKIMQYQQNAAQEANDLLQQKMRTQQSLAAAINSKGDISEAESQAGVDALDKHMADVLALAGGEFNPKGEVVDKSGKKLEPPYKCTEYDTYKSEVSEFSKLRQRAAETREDSGSQ